MPLSRTAFAASSPVAAAGRTARVASAVMLSSELPKIGGRVSGQEDQDPFSVWSPFTVFSRSFSPFCDDGVRLGVGAERERELHRLRD